MENQNKEVQLLMLDSEELKDPVIRKTNISFGVQNIPQVSIKMGGDSNDPNPPGSQCDS